MSMTRKNYIEFANMMAEVKPDVQQPYHCTNKLFYKLMEGMCKVFKEDNPNFSETRFAEWVGKASQDAGASAGKHSE